MLSGAGRHADANPPGSLTHTKSARPLELTFTALKIWSYSVKENGSVTSVSPSSA